MRNSRLSMLVSSNWILSSWISRNDAVPTFQDQQTARDGTSRPLDEPTDAGQQELQGTRADQRGASGDAEGLPGLVLRPLLRHGDQLRGAARGGGLLPVVEDATREGRERRSSAQHRRGERTQRTRRGARLSQGVTNAYRRRLRRRSCGERAKVPLRRT